MIDLKIENIEIKNLTFNKQNPRQNDHVVPYLVKSIEEFGFLNPIIIDAKNQIIAGHTRVKAASKLALTKLPAIRIEHLTPEQAKAFMIADNKLNELAIWDNELLKTILDELPPTIDVEALGFDLDELEDLVGLKKPENFKEEIQDDLPENVPSICKPGDKWSLGRHFLMCGDSTDQEAVKKLCGGKVIDLFLTDPPYNVNYVGSNQKKIQNDNLNDSQFYNLLKNAFSNAEHVLKPGGSFYIWHANTELKNFLDALNESKLSFRQYLIWVKDSFILGRSDYHWKHEPCFYGWKNGEHHFWNSDRKQTTILEFNKPKSNVEHPTMKPVEMFEYLINNSTKQNQNVLDLFGGSGTTIISCEKINRNAFVMELDPKYCDVIIQRFKNVTGQEAVKI